MKVEYQKRTQAQLQQELARLQEEYSALCQRGLSLDMSRGKPGAQQLDLCCDMLTVLAEAKDCYAENGFDCRNYGLLDGIGEAKELFAQILGTSAQEVVVCGNSSLNLMYDAVARAMLFGTVDSERPWSKEETVKFLCPCPGYDRHFAICEAFGIEMIPVDMLPDGPDMDAVERLVSQDASIKGIWCVPKYSNPQGIVYSDAVIARFASLCPKAKDFRIFWDNAYVVHSFVGEPAQQLNLLTELKKNGKENMVLMFTSTSKISFPGAGVSAIAASNANIAQIKKTMGVQTIGHDKLNQLRHVKYYQNYEGVLAAMRRHAEVLRPKFSIVLDTLKQQLGGLGVASWTEPTGGYFISLNVMAGCAKRVYDLAKEAGVTLTAVGATFPYGKDPKDENLRLAPTYPSNSDLQTAMDALCLCVRLAAVERLLQV